MTTNEERSKDEFDQWLEGEVKRHEKDILNFTPDHTGDESMGSDFFFRLITLRNVLAKYRQYKQRSETNNEPPAPTLTAEQAAVLERIADVCDLGIIGEADDSTLQQFADAGYLDLSGDNIDILTDTGKQALAAYQKQSDIPTLTAEQAEVLEQLVKSSMDEYDFKVMSEPFKDVFMELWDTSDCVDVIGCDCGQDIIRSITDTGRKALAAYQEAQSDIPTLTAEQVKVLHIFDDNGVMPITWATSSPYWGALHRLMDSGHVDLIIGSGNLHITDTGKQALAAYQETTNDNE